MAGYGNIKAMLIFETNSGYGWTETHWIANTVAANLGAALNNLVTVVAPVRAAILPVGHAIVGARVSYSTPSGVASLPGNPNQSGNASQQGASQNDSIACQMIDNTNTRKKIIHLRAPWQSAVQNETYLGPVAPGGYDILVVNYLNTLIKSQYGWQGRNFAAPVVGQVTNYTQNAADQVIFTVAPQVVANFTALIAANPNATYNVRFSKINYSHSVLNRSFVCTIAAPAGPPQTYTITTTGPVATGLFLAAGKFTISTPTFIQYAAIGLRTLGERRMGKPLSHYPGRGRRRAVI